MSENLIFAWNCHVQLGADGTKNVLLQDANPVVLYDVVARIGTTELSFLQAIPL